MSFCIAATTSRAAGGMPVLAAWVIWLRLFPMRGEAQKDGKLRIWAADKNGTLCGEMDLEFAS